MLRTFFPALAALSLLASAAGAQDLTVASPDGNIVVTLGTDGTGRPTYAVSFAGEAVIEPSHLGLRFAEQPAFEDGMTIEEKSREEADETWEQPWGERRIVADRHNELLVTYADEDDEKRRFDLRVRVFDDGLGFRYEVPKQRALRGELAITDETTEFVVPERGTTAWWIPARMWNRYEYLYEETPLSAVTTVHTPVTFRLGDGTHLSIHEAALVDYSGMALTLAHGNRFEANLAPRADGPKVKLEAPFKTPWRTIQVAKDAPGLINSDLILNLNEPNRLGDVSWVEPGKYMGIWWGMHLGTQTWGSGPLHGATTENTKAVMDFAAEHGFSGVLVEGWNTGWDGEWFENGDVFSFTEAYPDFDIEAVTQYGNEKGVRLIGHHETSGNITNYERQMEAAYDLYERLGVRQVKTGYVADAGEMKRVGEDGIAHYEFHDGQAAVAHHLRAVEEAAKRHIAINAHEPVKDTGLRRTYPNWISREGARGTEYDAWGEPTNPPAHTAILPFTRMLSGPMDYTPGIFKLRPEEGEGSPPAAPDADPRPNVQTTLAKQLALYVVLYSPIQMAADLPEHYEANPAPFRFIEDVPTDWEESVALQGEVGDYVAIARRRRGGDDWYLGAVTDEEARELSVPLSFLDEGRTYTAEIYRDGEGADFEADPYPVAIEQREVTSADQVDLPLARGGGAALRFVPAAE
ncbi:alpha-glucosidase [Parvularcula dongshanensis]|uniref:Alpha-glucosidase n=1 Tax=Parvularcula dongshanensis TaxID=1173995 RepID=A0A840I7N3_9PROT|nr:glycoside hydrolase family 97 protein [Parvularcula dongshanensis]MBB4660184.1 alpha-glucosidase [Parvularcula dongshanensis]